MTWDIPCITCHGMEMCAGSINVLSMVHGFVHVRARFAYAIGNIVILSLEHESIETVEAA